MMRSRNAFASLVSVQTVPLVQTVILNSGHDEARQEFGMGCGILQADLSDAWNSETTVTPRSLEQVES